MEKYVNLKNERKSTPIPPGDDDLCRALWLSVIVQAVIDAKSQRSRNCFRTYQNQAQNWISGCSEEEQQEFESVCELAGVDPIQMRKLITEALQSKHDNFNFRCLMKHAKSLCRDRESLRRHHPTHAMSEDLSFMEKARELSVGSLRKRCPKTLH